MHVGESVIWCRGALLYALIRKDKLTELKQLTDERPLLIARYIASGVVTAKHKASLCEDSPQSYTNERHSFNRHRVRHARDRRLAKPPRRRHQR